MSYCLLNVVDNHFRFCYAIAESIQDSRDVVFIILTGRHKIMGFWSKGMTPLSLEIPRRPIAPRSTLAPHSFQNQIQSRPDDLGLQSTPFKGTKLPLFLTARLYSHSCVEIQRSTSGKPEIVHCQGIARFQTLGSSGLEQLVGEHSLCNLTRELPTTA